MFQKFKCVTSRNILLTPPNRCDPLANQLSPSTITLLLFSSPPSTVHINNYTSQHYYPFPLQLTALYCPHTLT